MLSLATRATRYFWKHAYRERLRGFEVGFVGRGDAAALREKMGVVLDVIRDHDPAGFEALRAAMPRIFVTNTPSHLACYWRDLELCELRFEYAAQADPLAVAMTLVHEGVHARVTARGLHRRGLGVPREERLAIRAEIALARRAGADSMVVQAEQRLAAPESVYAAEPRIARELLAARQMGFPLWSIRLAARHRGITLDRYRLLDSYATARQRQRVASVYDRGPSRLVVMASYAGWAVIMLIAGALLPSASATYLGIAGIGTLGLIRVGLRRWAGRADDPDTDNETATS